VSVLRIVAAAYRDGWAFVEDGERLVVVRPPYRRPGPVDVPRTAVEQAVGRHGFEAQAQEVADLRALYTFLEERRVAIAEAEGAPSLSDRERRERLVRTAPRHILERYLDRVEGELIRKGELDGALDVLAAMSHADVASIDDALRERVSKLIAACRDALAFRRELTGEAPREVDSPGDAALRAEGMRALRRKMLACPPYRAAA
jgi:hypothetical protein